MELTEKCMKAGLIPANTPLNSFKIEMETAHFTYITNIILVRLRSELFLIIFDQFSNWCKGEVCLMSFVVERFLEVFVCSMHPIKKSRSSVAICESE